MAVESANPNIQSVLPNAAVLCLGENNLQPDPLNAAVHTYSTTQDVNLNFSTPNSQQLVLGIVNPTLNGLGIQPGDSLHFRLEPQRDDPDRSDFPE